MPTRYCWIASIVACGSHSRSALNAFSPASTLDPGDRAPAACFATAASSTRRVARQMSGPMPSPSMKVMIGRWGTVTTPSLKVNLLPSAGGMVLRGAFTGVS
jgi:hypothetical protein